MAARFIGLTVRVTLTEPKGQQIRGVVKDVGAGSQLTLSDGRHIPLTRIGQRLTVKQLKLLDNHHG